MESKLKKWAQILGLAAILGNIPPQDYSKAGFEAVCEQLNHRSVSTQEMEMRRAIFDYYADQIYQGPETGLIIDGMGPEISPDGSKIAFSTLRDSRIAIMDVKSKAVMFLTQPDQNSRHARPSWTPDGQAVIFENYDRNVQGSNLEAVNLFGARKPITKLSADTYDSWPSISESRLLLKRTQRKYYQDGISYQESADLVAAESPDSREITFKFGPNDYNIRSLAQSPDRRFLVVHLTPPLEFISGDQGQVSATNYLGQNSSIIIFDSRYRTWKTAIPDSYLDGVFFEKEFIVYLGYKTSPVAGFPNAQRPNGYRVFMPKAPSVIYACKS